MIQLSDLRRERRMHQQDLADMLGISRSAISMWETGRSRPDGDMLQNLSEIFEVSVDYLLGLTDYREPNQFLIDAQPVPEMSPVPIIGTVKAGFGGISYTEDLGMDYAVLRHPENFFYLRVRGDSMEPDIREGDLALIKKQDCLETGEMGVIILDDDEGTIKKFIKKDGVVILQSLNPKYPPKILTSGDGPLHIVGKLVEIKRKF